MSHRFAVCAVLCFISSGVSVVAQPEVSQSDAALAKRAHDVLDRALKEGQKWVKVHAAESLVACGEAEKVIPVFKQEAETFGNEPEYRIGTWRVLSQACASPGEKDQYIQKILAALRDPNSRDLIHAAESLGKLNYIIAASDRPRVEQLSKSLGGKGLPFTRWLLALSGNPNDMRHLAELLDHPDAEIRGNTAFALRYLRDKLPPDVVDKIQRTADKEPPSDFRMHLFGTAYVTAKDAKLVAKYRDQLIPYLAANTTPQRFAAATAFSIRGDRDDLPRLTTLLDDSELDIQVAAANAILEIQKRSAEKKK